MKYCTVNTHRGLYQFTRLPLISAPAQFQNVMDTILQGLSGAMFYIVDILVAKNSTDEHFRNLEEVFHRLQACGVRMKKKRSFMQDSAEYLGHIVDAEGIRKACHDRTSPHAENIQQLRSFFGLLNYYRKFLLNLATVFQPLNCTKMIGSSRGHENARK